MVEYRRTIKNQVSLVKHFGKCYGGLFLAIQLVRLLLPTSYMFYVRCGLYLYFLFLATLLFVQLVVEEELVYIRGLGVQMNTKLLGGKVLREFFNVETIEELKIEDILYSTSPKNALVLRTNSADNKKRNILFEVSIDSFCRTPCLLPIFLKKYFLGSKGRCQFLFKQMHTKFLQSKFKGYLPRAFR